MFRFFFLIELKQQPKAVGLAQVMLLGSFGIFVKKDYVERKIYSPFGNDIAIICDIFLTIWNIR